jgi:hypothetical protein
MKLKLFLFVLLLVAGGFIFLGFQETPVTPQKKEIALKREQFLP